MKILMVLTAHDKLGGARESAGFRLDEIFVPYYEFKDAGAEITLASPGGGQPPLDPRAVVPACRTESIHRFRSDPAAQAVLAGTLKLREVSAGDFDALYYPGGRGPLWDMDEDAAAIALIEAMLAAGKPVTCVSDVLNAPRQPRAPGGAFTV